MSLGPAFPVYHIETLRDLLFQAVDRYADKNAIRTKKQGIYRTLTYSQLLKQAGDLAGHFSQLGLNAGDRVGILSENRMEWCVAYFACVSSGVVVVPVDRELREREVLHILSFSGARALIASGDFVRNLRHDLESISSLEYVISMEDEQGKADYSFLQALKGGAEARQGGLFRYEEITVLPHDLAAIIFTSGTTGSAKGVMLSHQNVASNVMATSYHVAINQNDVLLSVLPLHHTYECTAGFLTALYQGATICHAESLRRIADNLRETQATVMLGVPALFEAMYRRIEAAIAEKGGRKLNMARRIASVTEKLFRTSIRRLLFRQLHRQFGGRLRLFISGGAALNPEVSIGFRELGIDCIQGYGMTEHSPIISVNRVDAVRDASVGLPLPGAVVKIVDDEIVVKSKSVMRGYYLNPDVTAEALREGWLYTGDLGYLDEDGFLYISGRKKSVIVTANGKNVYPEEIEGILNDSPYVLESLVWGGPEEDPSEVEVQAIIVPDFQAFDSEFGPSDYTDQTVNDVVSRAVKTCNRELASFQRIKKFSLRSEEFEKTTTRKIKRYLYTNKPQPLSESRH